VSDPFRLDGKVAVVTGASSGLGAEIARAFHKAGAQLVLTARRETELTAVTAALLPGSVSVTGDIYEADHRGLVVRRSSPHGSRSTRTARRTGARGPFPGVRCFVVHHRTGPSGRWRLDGVLMVAGQP
jgi:NAD(P)-dependent dehydrogenase (short-subunit alcohol dehydrogenase family)